MNEIKALVARYSHADMLLTIAVVALTYFAWRASSVDLAGYGEGIAAAFGGRGAHAWGTAQGAQQQ